MNYSVYDNVGLKTKTDPNIFYTLDVNKNLTWDDIFAYYIHFFGYFSVLTFVAFVTYHYNEYYKKLYGMWSEDESEDHEDQENNNKREIPYEMKWFEEFDDTGEEEECEQEMTEGFVNNLSLKTITETTPRGDVLMYYSSKQGAFVYHSKTKEIPYNYLETVARKYVIEYNCKKLYIDIRKEYEKGVNKYNEIKAKEEKNAADGNDGEKKGNKKKQIFANFKTYNRKGEVHSKQKDKIYILKEQANRYSYRGRIEEYSEAKVESCLDKKVLENLGDKRSDEEKRVNNIDFASFKKMNMNAN
jgi:hypothetical protein